MTDYPILRFVADLATLTRTIGFTSLSEGLRDAKEEEGMATHGYLIYTVRAHEYRDPDTAIPLRSLPDDGADLFEEFCKAALTRMDAGLEADDERSRAFELFSADRLDDGALWVAAESGGYGSQGNTTNVDSGDKRPFSERDATMTPKRAMFWLPPDSDMGLLFCERVSGSHIRYQLERTITRPASKPFKVSVKIAPFADHEAWRRYVDSAEVLTVSAVYRPTTIEDEVAGGRVRKAGELKMTLNGGAARNVFGGFRDYLSRRWGAEEGGPRAVEIGTAVPTVPDSLRPASADDFDRQRIEAALKGEEGQRTVVIERDQPPAFVYQTEYLGDADLLGLWQEETRRLEAIYGENVLPGWHPAV
ncbi:hypothetical protein FE697_015340 [Mumia zhuanghuii]|uniref:Uncharacterized protein n=2 Tax=Mumia TaxID=1546255 RepID=A0ABW1QRS4_9ACTN|nr:MULTISPECIES: hypothetical protein [Mumia]KAA1422506.1 hypothetical protein FE697_015340 [Mumia zhuanghuii]